METIPKLSWGDVMTNGQSVYPSWCWAPLWSPWPDFSLSFCQKIALLFVLGHSLWREDGSIICGAICQWSGLQRTHNHTLLPHLRILRSLSVASYDSQGLRWKYSNPPPHGKCALYTCAALYAVVTTVSVLVQSVTVEPLYIYTLKKLSAMMASIS
jgi:hypothetical protein